MNPKQAMRRYLKEFFFAMSTYAVTLIVSLTLLKNLEFRRGWQIVISLAPALPIIFVILAILRALRDEDELIQRIQLQAVVFSAITTGLITFTYGFLENVGFPHLPTIWILPMMFALWGLGLGYFNQRYQ